MSDVRYSCPRCDSDCLIITFTSTAWFQQTSPGVIDLDDSDGCREWHATSRMDCGNLDCRYSGIVSDFLPQQHKD
jgi:hypothetical protein